MRDLKGLNFLLEAEVCPSPGKEVSGLAQHGPP
jgi:hypothetical protein